MAVVVWCCPGRMWWSVGIEGLGCWPVGEVSCVNARPTTSEKWDGGRRTVVGEWKRGGWGWSEGFEGWRGSGWGDLIGGGVSRW